MTKNLAVNLCGVPMKNPLTTASGTFNPQAHAQFYDLGILGAVTVKGVADEPWAGNPTPRIAETYGGMLNSVGLQNPGADAFIETDIPFIRQFDTKLIVNLAGHSIDEYIRVAEKISAADVDLLELNISCPNIKEGGVAFGTNAAMAEKVVSEVKKVVNKPMIVKLSPNVTDITEIAKAAEAGGADALSLINTLFGMRIDVYKRRPILAQKMGGFSGPAVKPVAVRMVYQVSKACNLPIVAMGGVATGEDVAEFIMAGATMVSVGTANFHNPYATLEVVEGIEAYMKKYNVADISELIGCVK